jgi:hypothetical protein
MIIPASPAHRIRRKELSKEIVSLFGNSMYATKAIRAKLRIFHRVVERTLNSIFIFACIRAKKDEFIKEKRVNTEIIVIQKRARDELYQGRKKAIARARKRIMIQRIQRRDMIFPIIFACLLGSREISRIAIV